MHQVSILLNQQENLVRYSVSELAEYLLSEIRNVSHLDGLLPREEERQPDKKKDGGQKPCDGEKRNHWPTDDGQEKQKD